MQLDPLRGNPALVFEDAQLGIGPVEMDQPHEEQRQRDFPSRVRRLCQRSRERRLICMRKRLAHLPECLPDALGELGRAFGVLDVLLDQLAAIGAERSIDEFDRGDAVHVERMLAVADAIEGTDDVLLPPYHVECRKFAQPSGGGLRVLQRISRVPGLRG